MTQNSIRLKIELKVYRLYTFTYFSSFFKKFNLISHLLNCFKFYVNVIMSIKIL